MPTTRTAPEDSALRYLVLSFGPFDIGASLTAANIRHTSSAVPSNINVGGYNNLIVLVISNSHQ